MTNHPEPDPLDTLLAPPAPTAEEALRRTTWERSSRLLRRRRLIRRGSYVAGLAACYLAGLLTANLQTPAPPVQERIVYVDRPAPPVEKPAEKPARLEQQALTSEPPRLDLLRRAGDLYATEQHDLESALRRYGRSLDADGENLAVSSDDHWLLMAIKDARKMEKTDAKHPQ